MSSVSSITVRNQLKTFALLGGLSALLILLGGALAPGALWLFGAIAVAMNLVAYFYSHKIVLRMHRAREASRREDPGLFAIVEELSAKANIPAPKIYVIHDAAPNAFATGRNPAHGVVAVSTGLRELLTDRELRGVIAHELAHIANRDILIASVAAMVATAVSFIASAVQWAVLLGTGRGDDDDSAGSAIGALALAIVAPIAATIIQLAISRSREYMADATGARLANDPLALASALAKLERGNRRIPMHTVGDSPAAASLYICAPSSRLSAGQVASWFSTHPPIAERIRRLEALATSGPAGAAVRRTTSGRLRVA